MIGNITIFGLDKDLCGKIAYKEKAKHKIFYRKNNWRLSKLKFGNQRREIHTNTCSAESKIFNLTLPQSSY
jgi:hypothetical protein